MLHSLVRVSRRVGCSHSDTNNHSARCDRPPTGEADRRQPLHAVNRRGLPSDESDPAPWGLRCQCEDSQLSSVDPRLPGRGAIRSPCRHRATSPRALLSREQLPLAGSPQNCRVDGSPSGAPGPFGSRYRAGLADVS